MWRLLMQRFLKVLRWIAKHLFVKTTDLNNGEGKPHTAIVVGIKGKF